MNRKRLVTLIVGMLLLGKSEAWACGCSPVVEVVPPPSLAEQVASELARSDYVFLGTVRRREAGAPVFSVDAFWKGVVRAELTMSGSVIEPNGTEIINDCEVYFGDRVGYVVFAQRAAGGRLVASQCGFTRRVADAGDVLSALDQRAVRRVPTPR